jgi:hypothetical protein
MYYVTRHKLCHCIDEASYCFSSSPTKVTPSQGNLLNCSREQSSIVINTLIVELFYSKSTHNENKEEKGQRAL